MTDGVRRVTPETQTLERGAKPIEAPAAFIGAVRHHEVLAHDLRLFPLLAPRGSPIPDQRQDGEAECRPEDIPAKKARRYHPVPRARRSEPVVAWRALNSLGEVVTDWIDGPPPPKLYGCDGRGASESIQLAYAAPIAKAVSMYSPGLAGKLENEASNIRACLYAGRASPNNNGYRLADLFDEAAKALNVLTEAAKLAREMRWLGDDKPEGSPVYRALTAALARVQP